LPEFDRRPIKKPDGQNGFSTGGGKSLRGQRALTRRKENLAVSILRGLFPWKGDEAADIVRKIIFLGSLTLIIWSAVLITDHFVLRPARLEQERMETINLKKGYDGDEFYAVPGWELKSGNNDDSREVTVIGEYMEIYEANNDFVGWLEIYPMIQYPVYQHAWFDEHGRWVGDNEYYLNHNGAHRPTANGTVFADWEGQFTPYERPHNTIIYGHNLSTKNLFQPLTMYRPNHVSGVDSFEFLKNNPTIEFDTLYERGDYKIFAVFQSNVRSHQGEVFDYWNYVYFNSKSHFDNFVADILDRSYYYTNIDLQYGDELLLLSTCDFSIFSNGADSSVRLVVAARRVRDNEFVGFTEAEIDAFIDNRGINDDRQIKRRMFEEYYRVVYPNGWAGRNWNKDYIKDFEGY